MEERKKEKRENKRKKENCIEAKKILKWRIEDSVFHFCEGLNCYKTNE